MKYLFEKIPGYKNEFVEAKDKQDYNYLKNLVDNFDERGVDEWFEKRKKFLKIKSKENLAQAIGNYSNYFSTNAPIQTTKKEMEDLEISKMLMLLKHFNLKNQFAILNNQYDMESKEVISLLYETAKKEKKEKKLYVSRILLDPLFKMFKNEEFDKIKEIEGIIEKTIVDINTNKIALKIENSTSYFNSLKNNYSITDSIICCYSKNKRDFILSYSKNLPTKEKAYQLLEDITQEYSDRQTKYINDVKNIEIIGNLVNKYLLAILYIDLQKNLPQKLTKVSKVKI